MKQATHTRFFLGLAVLCLMGIAAWFVWKDSGKQLASGRVLTAQVFSTPSAVSTLTLSKRDVLELKERVGDIVVLLDRLSRKIQALPKSPLPKLTTLFQLTGTGTYAGYANVSAGTVGAPGTAQEIVISVKNITGNSATYVGIRGLSEPFVFKGGAYPGTGGTCGRSIPIQGCTLILNYAPSAAHSGTDMGGVIRHTRTIYIDATPEGADLDEPSNPLALTGYFNGTKVSADAAHDIVAELQKEPAHVFPNESSFFTVRVGLKDPADTRAVFFRDVAVSGVAAPFFVDGNECAKKKAHDAGCRIRFRFSPVSPGDFRDTFTVSFDVGAELPKQFTLEVRDTALSAPDAIDAASTVLVVYNADWPESVAAKNYYLANRPGFASANVLGVHFPVAPKCASLPCLSEAIELPPYSKLQTQVLSPIINELVKLSKLPHTDIQYIVLLRGLPTRPDEATRTQLSIIDGLQNMIRKEAAQALSKEVFVSSLDMGSLPATKAYIDKLKAMYARMPVKSFVISARGTGKEGATYYFSDAYAPNFEGKSIAAIEYANAIKAGNPSARVVHKGFKDSPITSASDVIGLFHRGIYAYGWNKEYATDGTIALAGNSGWWLAETAESFNGLWLTNGEQGSFINWFRENAYGGDKYSNTPVAAVSHVFEPGARGYNDPSLFTCWDSGKPFAYCAWKSTASPFALQAVGDPLVSR